MSGDRQVCQEEHPQQTQTTCESEVRHRRHYYTGLGPTHNETGSYLIHAKQILRGEVNNYRGKSPLLHYISVI